MIKKFVIVILMGFFIFGSAGSLWPQEMTGKDVMRKQKELHNVQSETGNEAMLLVDEKGGKEKRLLKRYTKTFGDDIHRYLLFFLKPADIRGTALLTWENKARENDQWLYLPAHKKMQRIAKGCKKNYFMGTDFTYEDMDPENIDSFNYTILRTETINCDKKPQACWVIESVPADQETAKDSGYQKRVMWIDKLHYNTLKVVYYDHRGRKMKTQTNYAFQNIEGTVWRAKKILMDHHLKRHKTFTLVTDLAINTAVEDNMFVERYILSGKYMQ